MHFRHISAKIQLKNLKQHFDWEARVPPGYALDLHQLKSSILVLDWIRAILHYYN